MFLRLANIAFAAVGVGVHLPPGPRSQRWGPPHRRRRGGDRRPRPAGAHAVLRGDERRPRLRRGTAMVWAGVRCIGTPSRPLRASGPRRARGGCGGVRRGTQRDACSSLSSSSSGWLSPACCTVAGAPSARALAAAATVAAFGLVPAVVAVRLALPAQQPAVRRLRRIGVPPRPVRPTSPRLAARRSSPGGTCGSTSTTC